MKSKAYLTIGLALLGVNILGVILRFLDLPVYIIILGFRFHLSLLLPFLFIINRLNGGLISNEFKNPEYKRNSPFLISILITTVIFLTLYFTGIIKSGDPEYFYEFGLSSILDFPVYLIWNSIHLTALYFFLIYVVKVFKFKGVLIYILFSLFVYEFIPLKGEPIVIPCIAGLVLTTILINLLIQSFRNIYWFTVYTFFIIWSYILLFGSSYPQLINIIFASQYSGWEGFFNLPAGYINDYSYPVYVFTVIIIMSLFSLINKKRQNHF